MKYIEEYNEYQLQILTLMFDSYLFYEYIEFHEVWGLRYYGKCLHSRSNERNKIRLNEYIWSFLFSLGEHE